MWRCDSRSLLFRVFYTLLSSVLPLASLYLLKLLVDEVTRLIDTHEAVGHGSVVWIAVAFCAIFLLNRIVIALSSYNNDVMQQRLIDYISNIIHTQSSRLDLSYYDNAEFHDTFHRAQQEASMRPVQVVNNLMNGGGAVVSIVGVVVLLVAGGSWMVPLLMIVAVLPSFFVRLGKSRSIYRFRRETTQLSRRSNYYSTLLTSYVSAKEVRAFGLAPLFIERFVDVRRRMVKEIMRISRWISARDILCGVIETVALLAVIALLAFQATSGAITIGSFVMMFEAFRRGQGSMTTLVASISGLYDNKLFLQNLFEFLDLKPAVVSPAKPTPFPEKIERVDFENITFAYPPNSDGQTHNVFEGYSLTARRGEITQIKGQNGFGKTTLLKLLLRLYDPTQGRITINGIDIREFDLTTLRRRVSAVFQDYVRFFMTASDNVRMGDVEAMLSGVDDTQRVQSALRLSSADEVVDRLSKGLDTPLGRLFDGGEELSMGQWQRIALARGLYAEAPIVVLDEPMAWMDVTTREKFWAHLDELKKERIVILISHL